MFVTTLLSLDELCPIEQITPYFQTTEQKQTVIALKGMAEKGLQF